MVMNIGMDNNHDSMILADLPLASRFAIIRSKIQHHCVHRIGGQSETAKFICKGYDTVDASDWAHLLSCFLTGLLRASLEARQGLRPLSLLECR